MAANGPTSYLVTGGTGLIGKQLVERLIDRGGAINLLIRPASRGRHAALLDAWRARAEATGATLAVRDGDVTAPGLDLAADDGAAVAGVDHVFHLAACYDLETASAQTLERTNVAGTEHLVAFLREAGFAGVLHHVSSVAVAGEAKGTFREDDLDVGQSHPHAYHRTKFEAEQRIRALDDLRWRIYRPSMVVGHSETGAMDRVDGPYYLFKVVQKARALPRWLPLPAHLEAPFNMVPVDYVAAALDHIAHADGHDGQTFHLVDPAPPRFARTFNLLADAAGAPHIKLVLGRRLRQLVPAAKVLGQLGSVRFLRAQLLQDFLIPPAVADLFEAQGRQRLGFDASHTAAALAGSDIRCPHQAEYLETLFDYWRRHLDPDRDKLARNRRHLAGRVVLITGSSSGVGAALAVECGRAGANVLLLARREPELEAVAAEVRAAGGEASVYPMDLNDFEACDALAERVLAEHGRVDLLVNNAARSIRRPLAQSIERFHDFERVMRLNYFAPIRLMRGFLPSMRERRSGHVVNVLTAGVAQGTPLFGAYGPTKAALAHLTDTAAAEFLGEGIYFSAVYLPWVRTPMMDTTGKYEETPALTPEQAARWILDGIIAREPHIKDASTKRRWVINALAPKFLTRVLSVLYRIYEDEDGAHSEFALDRALAKKLIKGRPI